MVRRLFVILAVGIILFGVVAWRQSTNSSLRNSIVFIGNPMVVVSWESHPSKYIILTIPSDMQIEAIHGYGLYSISSLWNLDKLEKRHGALFLPSLIENFTLPISWYSIHHESVGESEENVVQFVSSQVSFLSLCKSVFLHSTSMTPVDMLRVWFATRRIDASTTRLFDFRSQFVGTIVTLPDGSSSMQFDIQQYDGIVGDALENVALRKDSIRLAIYNTTSMPGIGSRVARIVENLGGYVVYVGNDDTSYDGVCELKGSQERLQSSTSMLIQSLYGCTTVTTTESMRGDLIMRLGKLFEKRYRPF